MSFEEDATAITSFEPALVPGLLQTEAYARAIHTAGRHTVAPGFVEKWVAARIQRQERLSGPNPLHVHAVIPEAAARLPVGGKETHADQLRHLLKAGRTDNITIQILTAPGHSGVASNFTVLHFADAKTDPPLGYFDGPLGGHMVSDEGDVATLISMFDDLRDWALPEAASTELLTAILEQQQQEGEQHA